MNLPETVKALREIEVIQTRVVGVEKAIVRGSPIHIEQELRELARLVSGLAKIARRSLECEYERLTAEQAQADAERVAKQEAIDGGA